MAKVTDQNENTQPVQEGGGEVCPRCKGAGEYEGFARHASGDPQDEYAATVQCEPCEGTGEVAAPPSAPAGVEVVPPEAKKVEGTALGAGFVHKDDWAIPSGRCSVRIVDQRMAYGWNQCREEMLERIAQQPAQAAPGRKLVPVEPTQEMVDAFQKAHDEHAALRIPKVYAKGQREAANVIVGYRAMLAATPPGDDAAGGA